MYILDNKILYFCITVLFCEHLIQYHMPFLVHNCQQEDTMPTTLIRTVLLYLTIVGAMKIMGKRQIGQMQLSELVTVTILSELASYAILDTDTPIIYSLAPVIILICIEVTVSFLSVKSRFLSRLVDGNPAYIIYRGKLDQRELLASRLTLAEVISEIRAAGFNSISEIYYMILEPSGKISVIPKIEFQPVTPCGMNLDVRESGIDHAIVFDGNVVPEGLDAIGKNSEWLGKFMKKNNIRSLSEIFYFAVNDAGDELLIRSEDARKKSKSTARNRTFHSGHSG